MNVVLSRRTRSRRLPPFCNAGELSPWAVDFRYETDDEPVLYRHKTLALIDGIRTGARAAVDG